MIVVDTGVFIDFLRGKPSPSLESIILAGLVSLSSTVYLELLQSVRKSEERYLSNFLKSLGDIKNWPKQETCVSILRQSRGSGIKVGIPDILILSDNLENEAKLMTNDSQMIKLAKHVKIPVVAFCSAGQLYGLGPSIFIPLRFLISIA